MIDNLGKFPYTISLKKQLFTTSKRRLMREDIKKYLNACE